MCPLRVFKGYMEHTEEVSEVHLFYNSVSEAPIPEVLGMLVLPHRGSQP